MLFIHITADCKQSNMKVSKKEAAFLEQAIKYWQGKQLIDAQQADKLRSSLNTSGFDWQGLAFYAFLFAITCIIISMIALLADKWLMQLLETVVEAPDGYKSLFFGLAAAGLFYAGLKRRKTSPQKVYSNEALFLFGVMSVATCLGYLGALLDNTHYSLVILAATALYGVLGIWFPSRLVWIFALISLGAWFGTETGYVTNWSDYFMGMNYPLRFVFFGLALTAGSFVLKWHPATQPFFNTSYFLGLLYLFVSLWLLSIFGNYGSLESWYAVKQVSLIWWSVLMAAVSVASILYGLKFDNEPAREMGVTFLFINLYTRYFEYGWEHLHATLFFAILALSFWLIGKKAEKIWALGMDKKEP